MKTITIAPVPAASLPATCQCPNQALVSEETYCEHCQLPIERHTAVAPSVYDADYFEQYDAYLSQAVDHAA